MDFYTGAMFCSNKTLSYENRSNKPGGGMFYHSIFLYLHLKKEYLYLPDPIRKTPVHMLSFLHMIQLGQLNDAGTYLICKRHIMCNNHHPHLPFF